MKKWIIVLVSLWGTAAMAVEGDAPLTSKLRTLCGRSDTVYNYLIAVMGEKASSGKFGFKGLQGESHRLMIVYPDNSWALMLEYQSSTAPVTDDVSCLAAVGVAKQGFDAPSQMFETLPGEWLGEPVAVKTPLQRAIEAPVKRWDI